MINSLRSVVTSHAFTQITLTDELGQSWVMTVRSDGSLNTALVPR